LIAFCLLFAACINNDSLQAQTLQDLLQKGDLTVCVHRAAVNPEITENSIGAMIIAKENGFVMHEIDLRESADGKLFLLHDRTLDRTTSAAGYISDFTADELRDVRLADSDEPLPAFSRALAWARENGVILMLDVKDAPLKRVYQDVMEAGMLEQVFLLTFTRELSIEALALDPDLMVSVLITEPGDIAVYREHALDQNQLMAYINRRADPELFRTVRDSGIPIITDTLREIDRQALREGPAVYQQFIGERMPDIVVSDFPIKVREAMDNR
jgi:glycerophosphoryl diester phosphodiesterase